RYAIAKISRRKQPLVKPGFSGNSVVCPFPNNCRRNRTVPVRVSRPPREWNQQFNASQRWSSNCLDTRKRLARSFLKRGYYAEAGAGRPLRGAADGEDPGFF